MRLEPAEVAAIKAAAADAFGDDAVVRVFGSRADDRRAGGDIDLYVEVGADVDEWKARARFESNIFARLEEQRIDIIVRRRDTPLAGIHLVALRDGVVL